MKRLLLIAASVMCGLGLCLTAQASYLEEEEAAQAAERQPTRQVPRPAPRPVPPRPENPVTQAVRRISVRPGHTHKGLTVFALEASRVVDRANYLSVEEALAKRVLHIKEKEGGSVPTLLGRNTGDWPILLLAGEILTGGKQNRTLQDDVLLLPGSGQVALPVFCVERGRWSGRDATFKSSASLSALNVRAAVNAGAGQGVVWENVAGYQSSIGAVSDTEDLQAVQESGEVREAVSDYIEAFRKHWRPATVGMVVARHGRIVGADIFCNETTFRKHRDRILESYAVDCYAVRSGRRGPHRKVAPPDRRAAKRFLHRTLKAHYERHATPGAGQLLAVGGAGIKGKALTFQGALLHAAIFAPHDVVITPEPMVRPQLEEQRQAE
ncbi:MAG: ARPP-1 family domain-containing protein [Planctomycetota bacterium]|jgi:hypothetical protein